MKPSHRKILRSCGLGVVAVVLLFVLWVVGILLAEKIYGGPHITTAGEAYGFKIGMTKREVFQRYREMDEVANIRSYGPGGTIALENKSAELKFSKEFQDTDHWMAYRAKFPIYYQEFFFSGDKLTNITTYIRFYETP